MGNGFAKLTRCFSFASAGDSSLAPENIDEGFGHSFCYAPLDFHLSGAAVSANAATALSTDLFNITAASFSTSAAAFECSASFFSVPLLPAPRFSGPLSGGFLSGPIERSLGKPIRSSLLRRISRAIAAAPKISDSAASTTAGDRNFHWAQGKAGEDRVHVAVSGDWVFVGIYDGFNGPDATDYLLSNLYPAVRREVSDDCVQITEGDHSQVLGALSRALRKTEEAYLNAADKAMAENPELALMGSCVLAMLMRGEDLYLMNVGDSRAVLGRTCAEEKEAINGGKMADFRTLTPLQLTLDHSTCVEQEVCRIKKEHPDDSSAISNDRVKGYLKVTRAFGAGFLKHPKWNDALLKMFRIEYIGTCPYITCNPSLYHYKLSTVDRFIILSSDGLYQYMTNEEVVLEVELFISTTPEGDPAQHLVEEVLFRAAKKAGIDFHELLEIPQGDRRQYHDDISVIIISLEGKIWQNCM